MTKSPFLVYQDFISPNMCDAILNEIDVSTYDTDPDGDPIKRESTNVNAEALVFDRFKEIIPEIEKHYGIEYRGTEKMIFQQFPEGMKGHAEEPKCQNSFYSRKKWVRIKDVDFTAILWLKDYNDAPPLDPDFEVYGGKLEFPAYNFSLQPQRGTLVVYPAGPHFISAVSPVMIGDLKQVRFNFASKEMHIYQPSEFPGSYVDWFQAYA